MKRSVCEKKGHHPFIPVGAESGGAVCPQCVKEQIEALEAQEGVGRSDKRIVELQRRLEFVRSCAPL